MNVVSFSGGKDSTAMLILMKQKGIKIDKIVFYDTLWEFDLMYKHIKKVENYIGQEIEFLYPDRHPLYLMCEKPVNNKTYGKRYGYGWPTMFRRWCTAEKTKVLNRWIKNLEGDNTFYIGIAADEKRPLKDHNKYPLIDYGITEKEALEMCYKEGFDFGGLYNYFDRVSCWCCPLGGKRRAKILWEHFPKEWAKIKFIQENVFHDFGSHDYFIEGWSCSDLENQFKQYGQLDFFNPPAKKEKSFKDYI